MKSFSNIIYLLVLSIFIITLIYLSLQLKKNNNIYNNARKEFLLANSRIKKLTVKYIDEIQMENLQIEDIIIKNIENKEIQLSTLLNTPKLIFKFSQKSCEPCVNMVLKEISYLGEAIGFDKIILIADYPNLRSLEVLTRRTEIKFNCYNYVGKIKAISKIESIQKSAPFIILLDNSLKIQYPFIIDDTAEINQQYFNKIIQILTE